MNQNDVNLHLDRTVRAESMEEVLRSLLAREGPPATIKTETELALWNEARMAVALAVLVFSLTERDEGVTTLPLGSVIPLKLLAKTKNRGPEASFPIPEKLLENLQAEDPKDRDLLLLVSIDNDVLKTGRRRIVLPGVPS